LELPTPHVLVEYVPASALIQVAGRVDEASKFSLNKICACSAVTIATQVKIAVSNFFIIKVSFINKVNIKFLENDCKGNTLFKQFQILK
jgi:hypothetical protein